MVSERVTAEIGGSVAKKRGRGRPRLVATDERILAATLELLRELAALLQLFPERFELALLSLDLHASVIPRAVGGGGLGENDFPIRRGLERRRGQEQRQEKS